MDNGGACSSAEPSQVTTLKALYMNFESPFILHPNVGSPCKPSHVEDSPATRRIAGSGWLIVNQKINRHGQCVKALT